MLTGFIFKSKFPGSGEMEQWIGVLAALPEDMGSSRIHMVAFAGVREACPA